MSDFTHWDIAEKFQPMEVASLIAGVEPFHSGGDNWIKVRPAHIRLEDCFSAGIIWLQCQSKKRTPERGSDLKERFLNQPTFIMSIELAQQLDLWEFYISDESELEEWLRYDKSLLENQHFSRSEVVRWLKACEVNPAYAFSGKESQDASAAPQTKSVEVHPRSETTYLNIIGALVELIKSPKSGRTSDAAVIRELIENYGERPGIRERTLQGIFPAAKRSVQSN